MVYREKRRSVTRLTGGKLGSPLDAWPVGSVYFSWTSANPATIFGGTWIRFAQGRMLVGVNEGDDDFNTVGEEGGSKLVNLEKEQIPPHTHSGADLTTSGLGGHEHGPADMNVSQRANVGTAGGLAKGSASIVGTASVAGNTGSAGYHQHNVVGQTGDGGIEGLGNIPVNKMNPYVTVYMWRRTA